MNEETATSEVEESTLDTDSISSPSPRLSSTNNHSPIISIDNSNRNEFIEVVQIMKEESVEEVDNGEEDDEEADDDDDDDEKEEAGDHDKREEKGDAMEAEANDVQKNDVNQEAAAQGEEPVEDESGPATFDLSVPTNEHEQMIPDQVDSDLASGETSEQASQLVSPQLDGVPSGYDQDLLDSGDSYTLGDDRIAAIALNAISPPPTDELDDVTSEIIRDLAAVKQSLGPSASASSLARREFIDGLLARSQHLSAAASEADPSQPISLANKLASEVIQPPNSLATLEFAQPPANEQPIEVMKEVRELETQLITPLPTEIILTTLPNNSNSTSSPTSNSPPPLDASIQADADAAIEMARNASYTGLLKIVQMRALKTASSKVQSSTPHVRKILARAIEDAHLEQVTEEWLRHHGHLQGHVGALHQVDEKDGTTLTRARPTIANPIISSSPSAPKIAGAPSTLTVNNSRSNHPTGLTSHRALQLAREEEAAQRVIAKQHQPFFQPPSTSPAPAHLRRHNPLKAPLPVHLASSSFAFYTSADQPPIQVNFAPPPESYPASMDMTPFQHKATSPRKTNMRVSHRDHGKTIVSNNGSQSARTSNYPNKSSLTDTFHTMMSMDDSMAYAAASQPPLVALSGWDPHQAEFARPFGGGHMLPPQPISMDQYAGLPLSMSMLSSPHPHTSLPSSPNHTRTPMSTFGPATPTHAVSNHSAMPPSLSSPSNAVIPLTLPNLSASILHHSTHGLNLQSVIKPLFPSYHSYKSTLLKKNSTLTKDVAIHAHSHATGRRVSHHTSSDLIDSSHMRRSRHRSRSKGRANQPIEDENEQIIVLIDEGKRKRR